MFECIDIVTLPMVLAVHESHPLASRSQVCYEELASEAFFSYEEDSVLFQRFMRKTAEAGYVPQIVTKAAETPFLLSMVEKNAGVLVVPQCVIDYRPYQNIQFINIVGEEDGYQLIMIYKKDKYLSNACQTFIDFIRSWYPNASKEV